MTNSIHPQNPDYYACATCAFARRPTGLPWLMCRCEHRAGHHGVYSIAHTCAHHLSVHNLKPETIQDRDDEVCILRQKARSIADEATLADFRLCHTQIQKIPRLVAALLNEALELSTRELCSRCVYEGQGN